MTPVAVHACNATMKFSDPQIVIALVKWLYGKYTTLQFVEVVSKLAPDHVETIFEIVKECERFIT